MQVAGLNPRTAVVVHCPGAVLMPWLEQVKAVLVGFVPGQEAGNAVTVGQPAHHHTTTPACGEVVLQGRYGGPEEEQIRSPSCLSYEL